MYDYTKVLDPNSLNVVEQKLDLNPHYRKFMDITDILYKYQTLYARIEVLRALNITVRLLEKNEEIKNDKEKYKALLIYLSILNNIDYKIDFHVFCEASRKITVYKNGDMVVPTNDPWYKMIESIIYRDRVIQPAKQLYPEFKKYLEDTEILLNKAITEIENRITIIIPGRIQKAEPINPLCNKKEILL